MPRWLKIALAALLPSVAGAVVWGLGERLGADLDRVGILVGLVGSPLGFVLGWWTSRETPQPVETSPAAPSTRPMAPVARPPLCLGEVPRAPRAFQPRQALRARIDAVFAAGGRAAVCSLAGARGVGKTHLAAALARESLDAGRPVAWLGAETPGQFQSGVDLMAHELGLLREGDPPEETVRRVREWLTARAEPYLLVLDDAADPDLVGPLLPPSGAVRVLITTNDRDFGHLAELVDVERFTVTEALAYLRERVGPGDRGGARRLAEEVDRLPLALSVAAADLAGPPRLAYDDYLARLRATPVEVALERPRGEPYPRGVAQTILRAVSGLDEPAHRLLGELSVLSASGVEVSLLGEEARPALADLARTCLASFSRDGSVVLVHRLVGRVVRERAEREGTLAALLGRAAGRMDEIFELGHADLWHRLPYLLMVAEQSQALWEHARPLREDPAAAEPIVELMHHAGFCLNELYDGRRAEPLYTQVVAARERLNGPDDPATLTAKHNLARAHWSAHRFTEAITILQDVAEARARTQGPTHADTLLARVTLGQLHRDAGRYDEAIAMMESLLPECARTLGETHELTVAAGSSLAIAHALADRPQVAIVILRMILAQDLADPRLRAATQGVLAIAHQRAGHLDEAIELYEEVLEGQTRALGDDHPEAVITRHELALAYQQAGRLPEAIALLEHVVRADEALHGPDHPTTVEARDALAAARRTPDGSLAAARRTSGEDQ
ncbi:tetratricopeptide repeat protein [Nonomuraea sp. NPDC050328]|uniref:tetratricopeptide repeat protein n=1 Tax=Nonomuraea sp. NPDC050328 TaxID=3364361 RepID=UPI00379B3272